MIVYDWEFRFLSGGMDAYQVVEGRDTVQMDERIVRLELHPAPGVQEEVIIYQVALAATRATRTEVPDQDGPVEAASGPTFTVEAGGSIRTAGPVPRPQTGA